MSFAKTWSGDWHTRISERVRERGYLNVTNYAGDRPGVPLLELAYQLGPDDVAAAQIRCVLIEEAVRSKTIPRMTRDLFARELFAALPLGWTNPLDETTRSEVAGAIADWHSELADFIDRDAMRAAGREFLASQLPTGWRPTGSDDAILVALARRCLRGAAGPS